MIDPCEADPDATFTLSGNALSLILAMWQEGEPLPSRRMAFTLKQLKAVHSLMGQAIDYFQELEGVHGDG